jgi:GNAT superfamily N-acetyltransferase
MANKVVPVTPERLQDLAQLFESNNTTKGCWCMAFIAKRSEYVQGGSGGNRAKFEEMAQTADPPMGLLAYRDGQPVGWCAVGPRTRYPPAISPRATILRDRDSQEDELVWLVPCFFVRVGHRRQGITKQLLEGAVALARSHGAKAVEGWPLVGKASADEYLGRRQVFEACGFDEVSQPSPRRVVMRLELVKPRKRSQESHSISATASRRMGSGA